MLEILEYGWGLDLVNWFQSWRTDFVAFIFLPFNYIAKEAVYLLLFPFLFWCVDKKFSRRFMLISIVSVWVNTFFKDLWMRPRPFQIENSPITPHLDYSDSYGIPSGHAQSGAALAAYPALKGGRKWIVPAVIFSLLMAVSRLVHGVHYPQDVIAGLLLGWGIVLLFFFLEERISQFYKKMKLSAQLSLSVGIGLILVLLFLIFPTDKSGLDDSITTAAVFSGILFGLTLEYRFVGFDEKGSWNVRVLRFFLGLLGAGFIYGFFKIIDGTLFKEVTEPSSLSALFRFIRYFVLGVWLTYGAPLFFLKLKLAKKK